MSTLATPPVLVGPDLVKLVANYCVTDVLCKVITVVELLCSIALTCGPYIDGLLTPVVAPYMTNPLRCGLVPTFSYRLTNLFTDKL